MNRATPTYPNFKSLLVGFLGGIPLVGITVFYCILHLSWCIPLNSLLGPFSVYAVLTILLSPLMYLALKYDAIRQSNHWRLIVVVCAYMFAGAVLYVHYGIRFGYVTTEGAIEKYLMALIVIPISGLIGFYIHRAFRRG